MNILFLLKVMDLTKPEAAGTGNVSTRALLAKSKTEIWLMEAA